MCISSPMSLRTRQNGLSMIELIFFILIVGVGIAGILSVMNITTKHSADPLLRKQALAIAEGLLEEVQRSHFTFCDPADDTASTAIGPVVGVNGCTAVVENAGPESIGATRPFDNVNDYATSGYGTPVVYNTDAAGNPLPAGYVATVSVVPETLGGIASAAGAANTNVLRITVMVSYNNDADRIRLDTYRTRYAPNALP